MKEEQSNRPKLSDNLVDTAEKYAKQYAEETKPKDADGEIWKVGDVMIENQMSFEDGFIAGADWQKAQMMDEWLKDREGCFWDGVAEGKKAMKEQMEVDLEKASRNVYESWMGGTMEDVRRDMVELGKVLNARKEDNQ